eukprot:1840460-Heterocapsa_arctica.AAC.1
MLTSNWNISFTASRCRWQARRRHDNTCCRLHRGTSHPTLRPAVVGDSVNPINRGPRSWLGARE